jgi:hypothetical protein
MIEFEVSVPSIVVASVVGEHFWSHAVAIGHPTRPVTEFNISSQQSEQEHTAPCTGFTA